MGKPTALKILFMGSPDFACPTLKALHKAHHICHVYTQPPRASGRGMAERKTPIATLADDLSIPVSWPTSLKDQDTQAHLKSFDADLFVVVAYGLLLPKAILDIPRLGCINGHASLLPRWRGAAPIQRAIEAGDAKTGTCAMMMEEGLDTGPVIHQIKTPIDPDETAQSLHDRLADITADCLSEAITLIAEDRARAVPQATEGVTYAKKISKQDGALDLSREAAALKQQIQAFFPFPGGYIDGISGKRLKCLRADISDRTHHTSSGHYLGQDDKGRLLLACGNGSVLALSDIQPAGKKPMKASDFANGRQLREDQPFQDHI